MLAIAIGHRRIVETSSDMEIKRKSLFFQNMYMFKNKFWAKTVISSIFLKKISKKNFCPKMLDPVTDHRHMIEKSSDMEMKHKSLFFKKSIG